MAYAKNQRICLWQTTTRIGGIAVTKQLMATVTEVSSTGGPIIAEADNGKKYNFGGRNWYTHGRVAEGENRETFSDAINIYNKCKANSDGPLAVVNMSGDEVVPQGDVWHCEEPGHDRFWHNGSECYKCKTASARLAQKAA